MIVDMAEKYDLSALYNGSTTFFRGPSDASCLDITVALFFFMGSTQWFVYVGTFW